ncbi:uroporphyrinogen-III C-methyltransferase [Methylomonas sp. LL1]|uniref:siroheme synthase CysG n=1 Tax=Methylomonas sp. LL1 TaxID=2785785 RepID=UPI0018C4102C|nr:siroheme synthase CysG [Methylomonas sp. LL1]QPK65379.1 uroporphyrinogen-III C-methyltransferase [Methylomonas sp. LL1]
MDYFPLFVKLKNQPCLVVGAGEVAARKIEVLGKAGARITVIAEQLGPSVAALQSALNLTLIQKRFSADDVLGMRLVISATNNRATNELVAAAAENHRIPVNVVDNPDLCSFIFPAIVDRSPLIAAISSGGASPVLARILRAKIESLIPAAYGRLAQFAEEFRLLVKQRIKQPSQRRIFWENMLHGHVAELVFTGKIQEAELELKSQLLLAEQATTKGEVYLIGAGPGDPDLLTFRALRLMQQADVIVYDRLVSDGILEMARRDAEKIYVGKQRSNHSLPQESINELLANLALSGKRVARLKGGDPFIFGRGGEEIETLMQQGIPFQVVPGITAASGCATYAGIPLTHRDHAQSCTFVTGHLKDGSINLNWKQLAAPNQTIVIYMGLVGLYTICQALIEHGCPPDHPIAIIQQGTTQNQRVITGTLTDMPRLAEQADIKPPTLIIVGTVVSLHEKLHWFQSGQPPHS